MICSCSVRWESTWCRRHDRVKGHTRGQSRSQQALCFAEAILPIACAPISLVGLQGIAIGVVKRQADFSSALRRLCGRIARTPVPHNSRQVFLSVDTIAFEQALELRNRRHPDGDAFAQFGRAPIRFPDERGWQRTGAILPPISLVDRRVNGMTTLAAKLDRALSIQRTTVPVVPVAESCSCGFALTGHGEAYNEQAFHHFLSIERKRSEASTRPFLLLLIEFDKHLGLPLPVGHRMSSRLFAALAAALRDTDVIGWYRELRIAGAVLTDLGDAPQAIMPAITQRVRCFLDSAIFPATSPSIVRVRLCQLPSRVEARPTRPSAPLGFA